MGFAIEFKSHPEANCNPYPVNYYCYNIHCPPRQGEYKHPRQDGTYKSVILVSKKGTPYRRKRWVCDHCGMQMTGTVSMFVFD
jgi:hypothetical protein